MIDSFPTAQFSIEGFATPYIHGRNSIGEGLLLHMPEDIPFKRLSCKTNYDIETLRVEINLKKKKVVFEWILQS